MREFLLRVFYSLRGPLLFPLLALALFLSCAKRQETHEGITGNYYSIKAEPPLGIDNPTFGWDILDVPTKSLLSFTDLVITENGQEMAFQADAQGEYLFELVIFNGSGQAALTQTYKFEIAGTAIEVAEEKTEEEKIEEKTFIAESKEISIADTATIRTVDSIEVEEEVVIAAEREIEGIVVEKVDKEETEIATVFVADEELAESKEIPKPKTKSVTPPRGKKIRKVEGRLTIQISSWLTYEDAEAQMFELKDLGFDAYVQRAYFEETGEIWYRVRAGAFDNLVDAEAAIRKLQSLTDYTAWVDHVRIDL